jgi:hypothetical protein
VTTVIRRPAAAVVLLAAAALLLSACGSGPSQVNAALIVGNTSVSVTQIQRELTDVLATQQAAQQAQQQNKLDEASRSLVTGHVLHLLTGLAATQYGLTVTDQQVDQLITQAGGPDKAASALFTDKTNVRDAVRDVLVEVALARKYADNLNVTFGFVVVRDRATAVADARKLAADPNTLNGLVSAANAAAAASGGQGGAGQVTTQFSIATYLQSIAQAQQQAQSQGSAAPTTNLAPVFGAPAGSVVAFQPDAQNDPSWIVALIRTRDLGARAPAGGASAASSSDLGTLETVGVNLLQPVATSLGVRISPRYGQWNLATMTVTPVNDQTAGVELPVAHARS